MLYSYSIGALNSKGKYILFLKSGENLSNDKVVNEIYDKMKYTDYDILEFNLLINNRNNITENSLSLYRCRHIESMMDFYSFKFNKNEKGFDQEEELITNKMIKASFFKKIIYKYKLNEIKYCINLYFDRIINFLLFKNNAKFLHIDTFGIIKYINTAKFLYPNSIFNDNENKKKESILYINFLFENTSNTFEEKTALIYEFFTILSIIFNKFNLNNSKSIILYEKFLKCKYISNFEKDKLKFYYHSLIN